MTCAYVILAYPYLHWKPKKFFFFFSWVHCYPQILKYILPGRKKDKWILGRQLADCPVCVMCSRFFLRSPAASHERVTYINFKSIALPYEHPVNHGSEEKTDIHKMWHHKRGERESHRSYYYTVIMTSLGRNGKDSLF